MNQTEEKLMHHEYDGIREYDNPTPGWWHLIFIASIIFSVFYAMYWHMSPLSSSIEEKWKQSQVAEYQRLFGELGTLHNDETTLKMLIGKADMMAVAEGTFQTTCASCHGKDGGGINGVNLTDDSYKNVKVATDIFNVVTDGANNGAMPSWKNQFSENERILLAAYIMTLRGKQPASPKQAEGNPIPAWGF
ncbi:cytochrome c oxidase cbb3-type subunit III [Phycisphaerales bacterium]|nr:cytochrome c oxidase cbb3-type subunit III [Phycisphaerales bacterium]